MYRLLEIIPWIWVQLWNSLCFAFRYLWASAFWWRFWGRGAPPVLVRQEGPRDLKCNEWATLGKLSLSVKYTRFQCKPTGCVCSLLDTSQMDFHLAKQRQEEQRSFRGRRGGIVPFQGCGKGLRISPSTSLAVGFKRHSAWVTFTSHRFCCLKGSYPTKPPIWRAQADNRGGEKFLFVSDFSYNLGWLPLLLPMSCSWWGAGA